MRPTGWILSYALYETVVVLIMYVLYMNVFVPDFQLTQFLARTI